MSYKYFPTGRKAVRLAFTLVEVLVAMAILSLVMLLLFSMVSTVSSVWKSTTGKISAFAEARAGFEAMTRKLSQATLNTYWDYEYPNDDPANPPRAYVRQSELHFAAGLSSALLPSGVPGLTTHGVFFHAPLGYSSNTDERNELPSLLNASGFFIQRTNDDLDRPAFLKTLLPSRTRYRLMELWQPTEQLSVYQFSRSELRASAANRTAWFTTPLTATPPSARPLAENVIAMAIWPRRAATDTRPPITPNYSFDTRAYLAISPASFDTLGATDPIKLSRNQLPPVIQITMVVLDEKSAARLETLPSSAKTLLEPGALFTSFNGKTTVAEQEEAFQEDLTRLKTDLLDKNQLSYRVFTTAVTVRQAKWSEE